MKCPVCASTMTQKVKVTDLDWRSGGQRCMTCGHVDSWGQFCEPPLAKIVAPKPGLVLPDGLFIP